jgi:hypothetical protein
MIVAVYWPSLTRRMSDWLVAAPFSWFAIRTTVVGRASCFGSHPTRGAMSTSTSTG